jgi:lysophospholipid acyltransferase (LPLAT)-like uncharacterized protein
MTESEKALKQLRWHERLLLSLLSMLLRGWGRTLRFRLGPGAAEFLDEKFPPAVIILWHNRLFTGPIFFLRYLNKRQIAVMNSVSKDGTWMSAFVGKIGLRSVRGSRKRRGARAVIDLIKAQREGCDIALTPDGSRGPIYEMKAGAITIALKTGAPIVLLSFNYSRAWRLNSWDRLYIPYPFSRIEIRADCIRDPGDLGQDAKEVVPVLEQRMAEITVDL